MKKATRLTVIGLLLAGLLFAADKPVGELKVKPDMSLKGMTLEQQRNFTEQRIQAMKDIAPLMADLRVKQAELQVLWLADAPSEEQLIAKARELGNLRQQIQEKRIQQRLAVMKQLTPEQRRMFQLMGPRGHGKGMGRTNGLRGMGHMRHGRMMSGCGQ